MSTTKKNIYQKIQAVRLDLQKKNLKKTGKNPHMRYSYYELSDFLPALNELMDKYGLATRYVITKVNSVLRIIDTDKPEDQVRFAIPSAELALKGGQPIQNLGGQVTYLRRYLLMVAFEIVESDYVDSQKHDHKPTLDEASIKKIKATKTLEELAEVCKAIKAKKGVKFHEAILEVYTDKKKEIQNEIA